MIRSWDRVQIATVKGVAIASKMVKHKNAINQAITNGKNAGKIEKWIASKVTANNKTLMMIQFETAWNTFIIMTDSYDLDPAREAAFREDIRYLIDKKKI